MQFNRNRSRKSKKKRNHKHDGEDDYVIDEIANIEELFIDIDELFFDYCIMLHRAVDEFWESRPSQIIYCIEKYEETINKSHVSEQNETQQITSMRDIPGWGDKV